MSAPKPVYAIVGVEPFLQLRALRDLLGSFQGEVDRIDVDGERCGTADVLDELRSFAMFGGHKLVVVRDADPFITRSRDALEAYLANPSDSGTLILRVNSLPSNQRVHKLIARIGQIVPCEPPKSSMLPGWIARHAKTEYGLTVPPDAAALLAELIGADLGRLDSELSKLAILCEGKALDRTTIAEGVAFAREQKMWAMTDALSTGDVARTLRTWRQLLQTDPSSEFRAVTWLTIWLGQLSAAGRMSAGRMPPFEIAKALKIWPAENVKTMLRIADRLGETGIRLALSRLATADLRSKSGLGDFQSNVERFLLSLA